MTGSEISSLCDTPEIAKQDFEVIRKDEEDLISLDAI